MNKRWTEQERDFIRKNAGLITDAEGARQLSGITGRNISVHSWRKQRQKLQMAKAPGRGVCKLAGEVAAPALPTEVTAQPGASDTIATTSERVCAPLTLPVELPPAQTSLTPVVPADSGVGCAKHYDF